MFSLSLVSLWLATISAFVRPTTRTGGLEISLSTPAHQVASISELRVVATVRNVGEEDLKILKPGTVLDNRRPTLSFIVTKDGKEVPFTGVKDSASIGHPSEDDWVVIPAGKNVVAEHIVSTVYDFSTAGPGIFTFDPVSRFHAARLSSTTKTMSNTARVDADNVRSVSVAVTSDVSDHDALYCDNFNHVWTIYTGFTEAKVMASIAASHISNHGATDPVYKAYFGSNPTSWVISNFITIMNQNLSSRALSCLDAHTLCGNGATTYSVDGTIHYCNSFHHLPAVDSLCEGGTVGTRNPRGAITLRELTLVLKQAFDIGSGCSYVQTIPDSYKSDNAENYMCFAAQVYQNSKC